MLSRTSLIPRAFLKVLLSLDKKFGALYLVGGALRDDLIKKFPVTDFDLITANKAEAIAKEFAEETGGRFIELDEERKIYRVATLTNRQRYDFDFANFQGKTLEEDLIRRDFAINTLAIPIECLKLARCPCLIDLFRGQQDIKKKTIRALNEKVLIEDPLRLLRAFRFAATLDFKIEPKTFVWIKKHATKLKRSAPERIHTELTRIFASDHAALTLRLMDEARVLTQIFPALERSRNFARRYYKKGGVLGHSLDAVACFEQIAKDFKKRLPKLKSPLQTYLNEEIAGGIPRFSLLKLAALTHDIAKPHTAEIIKARLRFFGHNDKGAKIFAKIGQKLRFSSDEIELVARIIRAHLRPGNLSEQPAVTNRAIYRFFRDLGEDGVGVLLVALADHQSYMSPKKRWDKNEPSIRVILLMLERYYLEQQRVVPPKLINGHDVMRALKIPPGPQVGKILDKIRFLQAEGKIKTKEEALRSLTGRKEAFL